MERRIRRRAFLLAAPAAAGVMSAAAQAPAKGKALQNPRLADNGYAPKSDYPRRPKWISEVRLRDNFWKQLRSIRAPVPHGDVSVH